MTLEEQWQRAQADGSSDLPQLTRMISLQDAHYGRMDRIADIVAQVKNKMHLVGDLTQRYRLIGMLEEIQEIIDEV